MATLTPIISTTTGQDIAIVDNFPDLKRTCSLAPNDFPDDFIFGVGSSAFQVEGAPDEGGRGKSIWDTFCYKRALESGNQGWLSFKTASNHYKQFETDVRIMKQLGIKSYRFSISWPRILPNGIPGKANEGVNKEGVAFYNNLINALKARDIEPFVTLFHWEVPQALEDKYGGFLSDKIWDDFKNYADFCFNEFGDRVKNWCTVNEPYIFTWGGYALGHLAPGRGYPQAKTKTGTDEASKTPQLAHRNAIGVSNKFFAQIKALLECGNIDWWGSIFHPNEDSPATVPSKVVDGPAIEPYMAGRNLLLAHAHAFKLYNTKYKPTQGGKIGITLNCDWYEAQDKTSSADIEAALRKLDFMIGWFMAPLTTGVYPKNMTDFLKERLPSFNEEESNLLKNSFDFIGINYYTAYTAKDAPQLIGGGEPPHFSTDPRAKIYPLGEKSPSSWIYVYGKGLGELLNYTKNQYGAQIEFYVTENGVDNKGDDPNKSLLEYLSDEFRIKYHQEHIFYIHDAINRNDVNVKGYFTWSFLDSFEWGKDNNRFGHYFVDYDSTGFERYPKISATWYKFFLQNWVPKRSLNGVQFIEKLGSKIRKTTDSEMETIPSKKPYNGVGANNGLSY